MLIYVYDDSFEGLLTAIHEAYYTGRFPDRMQCRENMQYNILDEYVYIETDPQKSEKVYRSIRSKISGDALKHVYNVFLSDTADTGTIIYEYLRLGWKAGNKVDLYLTDDRVFKVHDISRRVEYETHKMLGFVRFQLLEGDVYYAPVRPDNNILELLAPHFAERLGDQNWIIHDVRRDTAALYNKSRWLIVDFTLEELPADAAVEAGYQTLWKEFFRTVAIPDRKNPKLQRQFMPRRYWDYLTETK